LFQTMNAKINHFNNTMGKEEAGYIAMITLGVFLKKMTKWMFKDMPLDMQKEFITDIAKEANTILDKEFKDGLQ